MTGWFSIVSEPTTSKTSVRAMSAIDLRHQLGAERP
jgi:hypothetical protein